MKKIATTGNVNFTNNSSYRKIEAWPAATIERRLLVDAASLIGQRTSDLFITTFDTSIHMLHTNFTSPRLPVQVNSLVRVLDSSSRLQTAQFISINPPYQSDDEPLEYARHDCAISQLITTCTSRHLSSPSRSSIGIFGQLIRKHVLVSATAS
jgi:hypothetical protein